MHKIGKTIQFIGFIVCILSICFYSCSDDSDNLVTNGQEETEEYINRSLSFNGIDQWVQISSSNSLAITDAITLEAWIYPNGERNLPYLGRILVKNAADQNIIYGLFHGITNYIYMQLERANSDIAYTLRTEDNVVLPEEWNHITGTWDGMTMKIYINGILKISQAAVFDQINPADAFVTVGNGSSYNHITGFKGHIDEVRLLHRARSVQCIQSTMSDTLGPVYYAGIDSQLVGYWRFDEGEGNTATDMTIHHNDGVIKGATFVDVYAF